MSFIYSTLFDSVLILAGHGDSITGNPSAPAGDVDDDRGIGIVPIAGVILLGLGVVVLLMWLNRQESEEGDLAVGADGASAVRLKSVAPLALIAAVIGAPLILWTASSGGDDKKLLVERYTNDKGNPELLVSLAEDDLNTTKATKGKLSVQLQCTGRDGQRVLVARQTWPFLKEKGYEYPHAHQAATSEQVRRADTCRLVGAGPGLKADVKGALSG